jgi:hypothetical protein
MRNYFFFKYLKRYSRIDNQIGYFDDQRTQASLYIKFFTQKYLFLEMPKLHTGSLDFEPKEAFFKWLWFCLCFFLSLIASIEKLAPYPAL